uniref:NACHT domain-containing protein n=1 Tax=Romanomermis culicivorax TaxID=13658 RepID=A0A915HU18_ROMCU
MRIGGCKVGENVNPKLQNRFYASFVEQCAEIALEGSKHRHSNCLFVLRKFDDSEEIQSEMLVEKDPSVCQQLSDLKNNITQTFGDLKDNLLVFHTQISSGKEREFASYLEHFDHQIIKHLKKLIDNIYQSAVPQCGSESKSLSQSTINLLDSDANLRWIFDDAVSHYSEFLIRKTKNFVGHSENIQIIKEFCVNMHHPEQNSNNQQHEQNGTGRSASSSSKSLKRSKPIFISGEDGCGRTTLLCELGRKCQEWFNGEATLIIRFVSHIGFSKFANEMLRSLCLQMSYMNGLQWMLDQYRNEYSIEKLSEWLSKCCMETVHKSQKPLIIMVDDLDLLKYGHYLGGRDGSKQSCFPWIPLDLPENVIFVATISVRTPKSALPLKKFQGRQRSAWQISNQSHGCQVKTVARAGRVPKLEDVEIKQEGYFGVYDIRCQIEMGARVRP